LALSLLGGFALRREGPHGGAAELPVHLTGQRLLAVLALAGRPMSRARISETLWSGSDEQHAAWSLRATVHRLPHPDGRHLVRASPEQLALVPDVRVDLHDGLAGSDLFADPMDVERASDGAILEHIAALQDDVLPEWYDEWIVLERERHRQLRLHALEALSRRLTVARRFALAVHAGLAAVHAEPLRESAHRAVIEAHLAEGNVAEALRQYESCRRQLADELAITPSGSLQDLVFAGRPRARGRG
jgi:DNA-binding SARP family transcriptional activator